MCFKSKYIHFAYSYVVYVAFPSCHCEEHEHAVVVVSDPFSDLPGFFFCSEESIGLAMNCEICKQRIPSSQAVKRLKS